MQNSECQKKDWNAHKAICKHNAQMSIYIKAESDIARATGIHAYKAEKLRSELSKWGQVSTRFCPSPFALNVLQLRHYLLAYGLVNGLRLKTMPKNAANQCLQIRLERNSSKDPARAFNVTEITVYEIEVMMKEVREKGFGNLPLEIIKEAQENASPVVFLRCEALVEIAYLRTEDMFQAAEFPIHEEWKDTLRFNALN